MSSTTKTAPFVLTAADVVGLGGRAAADATVKDALSTIKASGYPRSDRNALLRDWIDNDIKARLLDDARAAGWNC